MRLLRTVAYAIQATVHLARTAPGVPVPCKQLARTGQMPERFLLHILRGLVTHGVLQSTRGADGGYFLSRAAHQITLRDIVEAFDNSLDPTLPVVDGITAGARTRLIGALQKASQLARQELQSVTVADLVRCEEPEKRAIVLPPHTAPLGSVDASRT